MKVSIITTFFNSSDHISDCLKSVQDINSGYEVEHILVNDGSKDKTLEIINSQKLKNIIIVGKHHVGRGAALNLGLKNATGDYICILDSDDMINPSWIDFFCSNYKDHDHGGVFFGKASTNLDKFRSYEPQSAISYKNLNPIRILFYNPICHSGSIFKHSSATKINGYSTSIKSQFDWDLWLRLSFMNESFIEINYIAAFKRLHSNQSFESKKHFLYTSRGVILQLKAAMRTKPGYFFPVFIFSIIRIIWSFVPRKLRTSRLFSMLR
jgi:glycosyltransferase involved in cell wall biosynthesis